MSMGLEPKLLWYVDACFKILEVIDSICFLCSQVDCVGEFSYAVWS